MNPPEITLLSEILHFLLEMLTNRIYRNDHIPYFKRHLQVLLIQLRSLLRTSGEVGNERRRILWPAGSDPDRDGIGTGSGYCHVIKPVNGMSLVAFVYPDGDVALVSQAA